MSVVLAHSWSGFIMFPSVHWPLYTTVLCPPFLPLPQYLLLLFFLFILIILTLIWWPLRLVILLELCVLTAVVRGHPFGPSFCSCFFVLLNLNCFLRYFSIVNEFLKSCLSSLFFPVVYTSHLSYSLHLFLSFYVPLFFSLLQSFSRVFWCASEPLRNLLRFERGFLEFCAKEPKFLFPFFLISPPPSPRCLVI